MFVEKDYVIIVNNMSFFSLCGLSRKPVDNPVYDGGKMLTRLFYNGQ